MKLRSTTWEGRNQSLIHRALEHQNTRNPTILIVGPGGVSSITKDLFPVGEKEYFSLRQEVQRCIVRLLDNFLRKHFADTIELYCYEVGEILSYMPYVKEENIHIWDIDKRVLDSIQQSGEKRLIDISSMKETDKQKFDFIFCYNVLQLLGNQGEQALDNLLSALSPEGILSIREFEGLHIENSYAEYLGRGILKKS